MNAALVGDELEELLRAAQTMVLVPRHKYWSRDFISKEVLIVLIIQVHVGDASLHLTGLLPVILPLWVVIVF